ncbi:flagellar assembly peptidoglycan hydrolase FlgJ [Robbsia sp. Bb-Pol-6]|uniref:Peptidoglycan hydrolase FlgJ n=1 Tax=Robbsia betulipollinis TaxID=2981849 RepID=A0ABT3ZI55_9BURK|nr:flagellar assembly peptidoglycan hydrolase FlgJ [Robbsia betulipollinis]MCY0386010.1 flagellar assembly peptidoglycan hydrolase FlgJ [Robbsia betulipollinis]
MNDMKTAGMGGMGGAASDLTQRFSLDTQGFDALRRTARDDPNAAAKTVAKQIDASFLQMMLKSMRDATPSEGVLDSQDGKTYTSMLDGQLSQQLSGKGMGLADSLLKQLGGADRLGGHGGAGAGGLAGAAGAAGAADAGRGGIGGASANAAADGSTGGTGDGLGNVLGGMGKRAGDIAGNAANGLDGRAQAYGDVSGTASLRSANPYSLSAVAPLRGNSKSDHVNAFIEKLSPAAQAASRATGIPAHFILSQVALESGWGKSEIRGAGGSHSHNVLGVKAGSDWNGPTVTATTTEYVHGQPHRVQETFRSYGSYQEALEDYAKVLKGNSRYQPALRASNTASGFANGMQKAGYATDPHYAKKLLAIIKQMV